MPSGARRRSSIARPLTQKNSARRYSASGNDRIEWETGGYGYSRGSRRGWRLHDELLAIAALVAEHREAFDAHVAESHARREWLEKKADHEKAKEQKTVTQLKPRL